VAGDFLGGGAVARKQFFKLLILVLKQRGVQGTWDLVHKHRLVSHQSSIMLMHHTAVKQDAALTPTKFLNILPCLVRNLKTPLHLRGFCLFLCFESEEEEALGGKVGGVEETREWTPFNSKKFIFLFFDVEVDKVMVTEQTIKAYLVGPVSKGLFFSVFWFPKFCLFFPNLSNLIRINTPKKKWFFSPFWWSH
jgi:hypothetical protein